MYDQVPILDGTNHMAPPDRPPQAETSDFESYMARTLGEEAPVYDANGKLMMSRRAIRNGLVFCAVFYGVLAGIIGGGIWVFRHFL